MSKRYESKVLEICENGDAIIELPDELCEEMGWVIGDKLDIKYENGSIILKKLKEEKDDNAN